MRLGEASHPGPATRQRRSRRLRALRDSLSQDVMCEATQVDSDSEDSEPFSSDQADDVVVRGGVADEIWSVTHGDSDTDSVAAVFQHDDVPPMSDAFLDTLERDLEPTLAVPALSAARGQQSASEAGGRRVVLIPASPEGTPRSSQDLQSSLLCNRFAVLPDDNVDDITEDQPTEFPMVRTMEDLEAGARSSQRNVRRRLVLTGTRERVDAIPVLPVPHVDLNTEEGLNNLSTSDAESVDDDERVAISDGESGRRSKSASQWTPSLLTFLAGICVQVFTFWTECRCQRFSRGGLWS